jgi:4-amino-4-deoxy-L-arabinose transferase-like glycosyltransferase
MSNVGSRGVVSRRDHVFGFSIAFLYLLALIFTATDLGMSRDESFYVHAADRYGAWYELVWSDTARAFTRAEIDRLWSYNNEHPALIKTLFAWSQLVDQRIAPALKGALGLAATPLFSEPSLAYRLPGMVLSALTLWLIHIFGARAAERRVGAFAALAFATLPRPFYHAHLDCFDMPIVFMLTWTTYAYYRALTSKRWAVMTGIAYGCALATKHNAWILPGILGLHYLILVADEHTRRRRGERARLDLTPYWLLAMLLIGPVIFLGTWPFLWFDTWARLSFYVRFHLHHDYYNIAYFGYNYFRPPFPVSFPFVMTLYTLPFTTTLLVVLGLGLRARNFVPELVRGKRAERVDQRPDLRGTDILWLGSALAPLVVIALPSTPIFGATKHWFPAYPFLCLFAGYAALHVMVALEAQLMPRGVVGPVPIAALATGILLTPAMAETAHSHPFGLSHYTLPAGGVPGAADDGMNRQFWGFTTGSVASFFAEQLPKGGTVYVNDTTAMAFEMLKKDGKIPQNIHVTHSIGDADFALVHHEHHMLEVELQEMPAFETTTPAHVLAYDGVPIVTIYENKRRRLGRAGIR